MVLDIRFMMKCEHELNIKLYRILNGKLNKLKENCYLDLDLDWWRRGKDT